MNVELAETAKIDTTLLLGLVVFASVGALVGLVFLSKLINTQVEHLLSSQAKEVYQNIVEPDRNWLSILLTLSVIDLLYLSLPIPNWLSFSEISLSLAIAFY